VSREGGNWEFGICNVGFGKRKVKSEKQNPEREGGLLLFPNSEIRIPNSVFPRSTILGLRSDPMSDKHDLPPEQAIELLSRLMLSWDGQWFLKVAQACGVEKGVELNALTRASFGRIEMREFLRALRHPGAASIQEATELVHAYQSLFLGRGVDATFEVDGDTVSVAVGRCSPQEGAGRAGLRPDTPCVACETVWDAWLGAAMPGSRWTTDVQAAMGRGAGACKIVLKKI
jgi:hypothetical protein